MTPTMQPKLGRRRVHVSPSGAQPGEEPRATQERFRAVCRRPSRHHRRDEGSAARSAGVTGRDRLVALGQWIGLGSLVGVICGAASALFLWLLERATAFREGHEAIVYALPIAGLAIGWLYERYGGSV